MRIDQLPQENVYIPHKSADNTVSDLNMFLESMPKNNPFPQQKAKSITSRHTHQKYLQPTIKTIKNFMPISSALKNTQVKTVIKCPLCNFLATTKNPYRHLQDHLVHLHFKKRIAAALPTRTPFICPMLDCEKKKYHDWQALMRHYISKKHGILRRLVEEELDSLERGDISELFTNQQTRPQAIQGKI